MRKSFVIFLLLSLSATACWPARATPTPTPTRTPLPITLPAPATNTPAPPPPTPVPPSAIVTAGPLNLRSGPGTNYDILGRLQEGEKLEIVARNAEGDWLQVLSPAGVGGWVATKYVQASVTIDAIQLSTQIVAAPTLAPATPVPAVPPATSTATPAPPTPQETDTPTLTPVPSGFPYQYTDPRPETGRECGGFALGTVSGKVYDANGNPLPGVRLRAWNYFGWESAPAVTKEDGSYEFTLGQEGNVVFYVEIIDQNGQPLSPTVEFLYPGAQAPGCHIVVNWNRLP